MAWGQSPRHKPVESVHSNGRIPEGVRNVTLCSRAGSLRARGASREKLLEALRDLNREQCDPPLPDAEIRAIAKSIGGKPPYPTARRDRRDVPRGCFDPRPTVCGFDAAAVVLADGTLRLKRRHKALFRLLRDHYGPLGCHPSQITLGDLLLTSRQQVARDIGQLVGVGLIYTEPGAYHAPGREYPCTSYHFRRHTLFHPYFGSNASVSSASPSIMQHPTENGCAISPKNEPLTENHATRVAQVTKYARWPLKDGDASSERKGIERAHASVEIEPCACETTAGYWITQYVECAKQCGGARIAYADGTVKRYGCSCEGEAAA